MGCTIEEFEPSKHKLCVDQLQTIVGLIKARFTKSLKYDENKSSPKMTHVAIDSFPGENRNE